MSSHDDKRRQVLLEDKRKEMMEQFEKEKAAMTKETEKKNAGSERFVAHVESMDEKLKKSTVGLVNLKDFQERRKALEEEQLMLGAQQPKELEVKKKKTKKKEKAKLSFDHDEEDEEEEESAGKRKGGDDEEVASTKRAKFTKNPTVDTSFLPDREREERERFEREELRRVWIKNQEVIKNEDIEITYSYWDGAGHRRVVSAKKGDDIATFLEKCRLQFPELRGTSVDNLMYIKEDLIIPHHYTFYDFIINKARGKSGPLFNFDVHDDVRLMHDATVEKDESHAGKVVERSWYNRSKHIFPASRWEVYDPEKDYGGYKIAGV
ncbi:XAP5, circadian clock regulator-domain-containing protein [Mrakia frigida]|uniref:FAM50/XAP5 family protein n=1 Tax=Mrakia frigida TaxID=29902 RepID=UPI003FCBF362